MDLSLKPMNYIFALCCCRNKYLSYSMPFIQINFESHLKYQQDGMRCQRKNAWHFKTLRPCQCKICLGKQVCICYEKQVLHVPFYYNKTNKNLHNNCLTTEPLQGNQSTKSIFKLNLLLTSKSYLQYKIPCRVLKEKMYAKFMTSA